MNKDKYNKQRLFNLMVGFFPSILCRFFKLDKDRVIFNSEFNTEFNHNTKYLFLYFLEEYPQYEIKFVLNDSERRKLLTDKYGDHFISSVGLKEILYILKAKTWITSSLETPTGGIYLNRGRNVFHLGHGAPLKNVGLSEGYGNWKKKIYYRVLRDNFSYFLSTSEMFSENWSRCIGTPKHNVIVSGQARSDLILSTSQNGDKISNSKSVLYAPTWRPFSDTELFPFADKNLRVLNDNLVRLDIVIYLRLHPNFDSQCLDEYDEFNNIKVLGRDSIDDINEALGKFDLLITDYSSIYIDFLLTKKPVLFLPYDQKQYSEIIGFSIDYSENTPGPKPTSQHNFVEELDKLINIKSYYALERKKVNDRLNEVQENHCKSNAELILSFINR
ncbi:CDP-glycerol glycerophosphotransferase [Vibrio chagasii]|nr:CDP-glycerol glycerophosphotransferase [Vibrio chagasii]CAH6908695.1 CDP-glycerol glycerophosphotransferase [Vibrio chagasii]